MKFQRVVAPFVVLLPCKIIIEQYLGGWARYKGRRLGRHYFFAEAAFTVPATKPTVDAGFIVVSKHTHTLVAIGRFTTLCMGRSGHCRAKNGYPTPKRQFSHAKFRHGDEGSMTGLFVVLVCRTVSMTVEFKL
jgi:hypothetical protein